MGKIKRIFLCSSYRKKPQTHFGKVKKYAESLARQGILPIAPQLYFTQFLVDDIAEEELMERLLVRELLQLCDELWVIDKYISEGMEQEIAWAELFGIKIKYKAR